jgi:molybdopterin/thiamine biosynthesis adenylyltransferase
MGRTMPAPRTFRIRPGLEVFPATNGTIYLIRDQMVAEFTIEDADDRHRLLFELLEQPRSLEGLSTGLAAAGRPMPDTALGAALAELDELGVLEADGVASDHARLSPEEAARYDRQLAYFAQMGPRPAAQMQLALRDATVVIVGVGGLGTWAASALATAGIGHLRLVDDDEIDLSNLNRQILFRRADVARRKVDVASEALRAFNPGLRVTTVADRVDTSARAEAVADGADFLVETADWPPYQLSRWLDGACWSRRIPRIVAAQFPPRVRIGPTYVHGRTGCLECQERATRRDYPLYDELVEFRSRRPVVAATLGPASGIIGATIAMEVVHHLTGIAPPATLGVGLTIDLRDWAIEREHVPRLADCHRCGAGG